MNVLLLGSGGREHALAWRLRQSPLVEKLYCAPGSEAIAQEAERLDAKPTDAEALKKLCAERKVGLVVIGPEEPLAAGVADALREAGVLVFGPGRAAARLESSKTFAKEFMGRHKVPTARWESCRTAAEARAALAKFAGGVVVKADGLAAGKGVRVCADRDEAEAALDDIMVKRAHGEAGASVVLEERLEGPEVSLLGLCDGKRFLPLPPAADHKRLLDGDEGPNTGGMGVVAPSQFLSKKQLPAVLDAIVKPVLKGLAAEKLDYRGLLYFGLMMTAQGPKLLEFNCRFGDPETQSVLPLLDADLAALCEAAAKGELPSEPPLWHGAAVTVVVASEGYPAAPVAGRRITGLAEAASRPGVLVFHAGTAREEGIWRTTAGRVLGVTGVGKDVAEARQRAYAAAELIQFEGAQYRRDIGLPVKVTRKVKAWAS
ncbi:MAG: phosphoribosylamine--glycine ligase [Elusimicrobia bacterium]|nr:phosphoribosylamine--glycine ligase [Elusimicrobiota bacterium]